MRESLRNQFNTSGAEAAANMTFICLSNWCQRRICYIGSDNGRLQGYNWRDYNNITHGWSNGRGSYRWPHLPTAIHWQSVRIFVRCAPVLQMIDGREIQGTESVSVQERYRKVRPSTKKGEMGYFPRLHHYGEEQFDLTELLHDRQGVSASSVGNGNL